MCVAINIKEHIYVWPSAATNQLVQLVDFGCHDCAVVSHFAAAGELVHPPPLEGTRRWRETAAAVLGDAVTVRGAHAGLAE